MPLSASQIAAWHREGFDTPIPVAVSSCLLGEPVRFDGNHKHMPWLTGELARYVAFEPVCPEVAIGLGVPRVSLRLVGETDDYRAVTADGRDVTDALEGYADRQARALGHVDGYVFMRRSPSCGVEAVRLYRPNGNPQSTSVMGAYARRFVEQHPLLPVEDSGKLNDTPIREQFVTRVFAHHAWRRMTANGTRAADLYAFHTAYKYVLLRHNQGLYRQLGRLLAGVTDATATDVAADYLPLFFRALARPARRANTVNVMQHLLGFLKHLPRRQRSSLETTIERYRNGILPASAPFTLLRHHLAESDSGFAEAQVVLQPVPEQLPIHPA